MEKVPRALYFTGGVCGAGSVMKVEAHTLRAASAVWRALESHLAHSRHREERKVDLGKGRTRILNITFIRNVHSRDSSYKCSRTICKLSTNFEAKFSSLPDSGASYDRS